MGSAPAPGEMADAPAGPSSEEEAMLLAEQGEMGEDGAPVPKPAKTMEVEDEKAPLPPMEDLINRIPAPARVLLDELFRSRFITVKRVPLSALKN